MSLAPPLGRVVAVVRLLATRAVAAGQFAVALDFAGLAPVAGVGDAAADVALWF